MDERDFLENKSISLTMVDQLFLTQKDNSKWGQRPLFKISHELPFTFILILIKDKKYMVC